MFNSREMPSVSPSPYGAVRASMRNGDYLFCSGSSAISRTIQAATKSWSSHVGKIVVAHDRVMVAESVESVGTRLYPLSRYVRGYDGSLYIARHKEWRECAEVERFARFVLDHQGQRYDGAEIGRILARIVGFGSEAREENDAWICSEYAAEADRFAGVGGPQDPRGFVSPATIADWPDVEFVARLR